MWKGGLIEETKKVLSMGFSHDLNSLNTVGYKECVAFLNNRMSESEALDKMKQNTRRYAKRQFTWFRRNDKINWIKGDLKKIAETIIKYLKEM